MRRNNPFNRTAGDGFEHSVETTKWSITPLADKFAREEDQKWKLTNIYSKPFVAWSASHTGVCDGYGTRFLSKERVIAPNETLEILTRHRTRSITLSCTEYETLEAAQAAYEYHLQNPEKYYGELSPGFFSGPVFPFQWCELFLDHRAYYEAYQALPESQPIYPVKEDTSWPGPGSRASGSLFRRRL